MFNICPWCGQALYRSAMRFGPLSMRSGKARYCRGYHYFESICTFGIESGQLAPEMEPQEVRRIRIVYDDPRGNIPVEAKQVVDAMVYALHRVVLHEHIDDVLLRDLRNQTLDAAIRSCETLMDKLIGDL